MTEEPSSHGLPDRLRVNPAVVLVAEGPDKIHFRAGPWSGPMSTLRDRDGDGALEDLVAFLTGDQRTDEYLATLEPEARAQVSAILSQLLDKNLVQPQNSGDAPTHAAGYVPLNRWSDAATYERVRSTSVLIVSTGRIGEMVRDDLIEYGVEDVRTLDVIGDAGSDDRTQSVALDDLPDALEDVDLMVYAGDRPYPDLLERLNRQALEAGTEWVSGQVIGFDGIVGPFVYPEYTACYNCFKERLYASLSDPDSYRTVERARNASTIGTLPNFARVVAGLLVTEAVTYLATGVGFTAGRVIQYDFHDLSVETDEVLQLPRCADCGISPVADADQSGTKIEQVVDDIVLEDYD